MQNGSWCVELTAVLPEIVLSLAVLALLVIGVMRSRNAYYTVLIGILAALAGIGILYATRTGLTFSAFHGFFQQNTVILYTKFLVLISAGSALLLARPHLAAAQADKFEYPILIGTSVLGMLLALSAGDFISLYVAIELQSLSLYILATFTRERREAAEAGLKYFLLGSLSSGLLLFGISILYGLTGSTNYVNIAARLTEHAGTLPALLSLVFILAGLAFKTSAAPFHMWTPDVYQGAPTPVTAHFSMAPKASDLTVMLLVLMGPLAPLVGQWQQIIIVAAILSMAVGSFTALMQPYTKRLLAYSSINHVGFILLGIAVNNAAGIAAVLIYIVTYLLTSLATFALLLLAEQQGEKIEKLSDLAGLAQRKPRIALGIAMMMFSMAGIPPMAGFWGKLVIFQAVIQAGWIWLATAAVLFSVVAVYYYLRVIKIMYFDKPEAENVGAEPLIAPNTTLIAMAIISSAAVLSFIIWANYIIAPAQTAAQLFFPAQ